MCQLSLTDRDRLKSILIDYHCMVKVKAYMDEFAAGLAELGVLDMIRMYPHLTKPLFVSTEKAITAGMEFNYAFMLCIILNMLC